jgi:fermentation-respiration switch protein FrsA (DUF1100 family)
MLVIRVIVLSLLCLLIAAVVISAGYGQTILFKPSSKVFYTPTTKFTEFNIKGVNGRFFNNFPGKRTILYCHGNNDNITERKYIIDICNDHSMNLLLFDYQGFGQSKGTPYQYSLQPDAQIAYNYLIDNKVRPEDIIIWGESLGGNPAVYLAETNKCGCLFLLSTFSSLQDVIGDYPGRIWKWVQKTYKYIFDISDTASRIVNIKVPVIIVHSVDDEMVPFPSAERLYNKVPHDAKILIRVNGRHGAPVIDANLIDRVMKYLSSGDFTSNEAPIFVTELSASKVVLS